MPKLKPILLAGIAAIVLFSSLAIPQIAAASHITGGCKLLDLYCHGIHLFEYIAEQIGNFIGFIAAFFVTLFASLIQVLVNVSRNLTSLSFVRDGFEIVLSIANLGFVLAIIVIAFATILRMQSYAMKQLLWKLVVAALLVNFSFAIAGIFIDFTNILGNFFLAGAVPGGDIKQFGSALAGSLDIQKILQPELAKGFEAGGIQGFTASKVLPVINIVASLVATAIFTVILAIVFAAIAFLLLIRLVYLMVLLIVMPLVWLFWIFPGLSKHWSEWWNKFIQWTFFYPAMMFFVFLSLKTTSIISDPDLERSAALDGAGSFMAFGAGIVVVYLQIIIKIGILVGGLIAAQKMGIASAGAFLNAAKGSARWMTTMPGRLLGRGVAAAGGTRVTKAFAGGLANLLTRPGLSWIPGAKTAAAGLAGFAERKSEVEEYQKKYLSNLTKQQWDNTKKSMPLGPVAQAAMLAEAAKRRDVDGLTEGAFSKLSEGDVAAITRRENVMERIGNLPPEKQALELMSIAKEDVIKKYANAAQKTNPDLVKEVVATYPQLSEQLTGKSVEDTSSKLGGDKVLQLSDAALSNARVVLNLSEGAISTLMRSGSKLQSEKIASTIKDAVGQPLQKISDSIANAQRELKLAPKAQVETIKESLRTFKAEEIKILSTASENQKRAYSRLNIINQRIGSRTNLG